MPKYEYMFRFIFSPFSVKEEEECLFASTQYANI